MRIRFGYPPASAVYANQVRIYHVRRNAQLCLFASGFDMKNLIFFYFKPEKHEIDLEGIKIRSVKFKDLGDHNLKDESQQITFSLKEYGEFVTKQGVQKIDDLNITLIEYENDSIPTVCVESLFYLIFSLWPYQMHELSLYNQPINLQTYQNDKKFDPPFLKISSKKKYSSIKSGYSLLCGNKSENKRFKISLLRWASSYRKIEPIESLLDCCSSLEALLNLRDELRLRLSFSVYYILKTHKKESFLKTYEMYGLRNKFIHGDPVPEITDLEQRKYIKLVGDVLFQVIKNGKVPNIEILSEKIIEHFG